jgi:hypothetical protein
VPPDQPAECVATNQGENQMESTVGVWTPSTFEQRLAALDRAINYAHNCTFGNQMSADDVVALADQFEQYLSRTDA